MKPINQTKVTFEARSINEAYARGVVAAFLAQMDPTVPQLADIKTAVSEAVTNAIIHGYPGEIGLISLSVAIYPDQLVKITISDKGHGIADVKQAMEPMFTTGNREERSGLGFSVMQTFMDKVKVSSVLYKGTRVILYKKLPSKL